MKSLLLSRFSLVWLLLLAATLLSWGAGHGVGLSNARYANVVIITIAFVKVRLVMLDFMDIRQAPLFMRWIAEAWAIVLCMMLITLDLLA